MLKFIVLTLFLCISTASDCFILQKGIEKDERLVIIDRHNEIRQQIALGKNLDLPSSSKMYELQWDYHLAELAQSESEICTDEWEEKNNEFQEDEIKTSYYTYHVSTMYQNMNLNTPLNIWFSKGNLIRKIDIINGILDEKIEPFVNLVYGKNIKVGCGLTKIYENSWWKVNFICKYEALPHNKFDSVYEIGFACEKCTDSCSKIWEGLCSNPSIQ